MVVEDSTRGVESIGLAVVARQFESGVELRVSSNPATLEIP